MINASFKVFWNNPVEMLTETSPQQLEFEIPLGAIIADPNLSVDLSNYDTRAEVDVKVASANSYTDVQVQSSIAHTNAGDAALYLYVNDENDAQDLVIANQQAQITQNKTDSEDRDQTLQTNIDTTNLTVTSNKTYQDNKNASLDSFDASLQLQVTTNKDDSETRDTSLGLRIDNLTAVVDQDKADQLIKDTAQDNLINTKASTTYVDSSNASQDVVIALKADKTYVDTQNSDQDAEIALKANTTYVDQQILDTRDYADSKVQQTVTNGITDSAPSQDAVYDRLQVKQNLPTGYLTGWQLSINALNNTKFDISAGSGIVTDFTDLTGIQPEVKQTLSPLLNLTPQFLLTHPASYIAFDKDLNVVQRSSPFTNEDRRTLIILGSVIHSNNINVNVTNEIKAPIVSPTNQLHDFMLAVGAMNLVGNEVVPNGNNLSINITAGTVWKMGISASNQLNPHQLNFPLRTSPQFTYRLRNSTEYPASNLLDPTHYDLNGVRTLLANNNRWTIQRVYLFQSGLVRLQYGQAEYTSYQNALNALSSEPFAVEQNIKDNGLFIARIIIKKTCTDLTADINSGIASIHVTDKFGNSVSTAAITASAIISALGYTPVNPRKTVNNRSNDYTLQASDAGNIVRTTGAGAHNITVPTEVNAGWVAQDRVEIEYYGTGQPTVVPAAGVTIRVAGGGSLALTPQYSRVTLEYVGSNEWLMFK